MNDAGMVITETTITGFKGWDSNGIAEFVRARKAMQYAESIDDFARIMQEGNNGGYANDWLVADTQNQRNRQPGTGAEECGTEAHERRLFHGREFPHQSKAAERRDQFQ